MSAVYPVSAPRLSRGVTAADLQVERGDFAGALEALLRPQPQAQTAEASEEPLRFSRHAQARLESRGLSLSEADREALSGAMDRLQARGARESLVLMDDHAFIVGVQRRTVITAMTRGEAMGNVFTQIDSTLVVR